MKSNFSDKIQRSRIGTKILISFLGLSLISLSLFGFIAVKSNTDLGDSAVKDSEVAIEGIAEQLIKQIALDVAKQVEIYIRDHPDMNITKLQGDGYFSEMAVQPVGITGYTALTDVDTLTARFHASPMITNLTLSFLADSRPGFWKIMNATLGGFDADGYYDWTEDDGSVREKYMYIAVVNASTADGVTLSVAATTYMDEFSAPVKETEKKIDDKTIETRNTLLAIFFLLILVVLGTSLIVSRTITRPILTLTEGAEAVGKGDLDYRVDVRTGDELEDLANTFNDMGSYLKLQMQVVEETSRRKERIERELQIAQEIQKSFLPIKAPVIKDYELAGVNLPAREVGGDFYDFIELDEDRYGIVVADVSGKGVPAALFMGLSKTLLRANAKRILDPVEALKEVNTIIVEESDSGMFITLFYAILDARNHTFTFINAGHNPPLLLKHDDHEFTLLKAKGIPVGVMDDMNLESKIITLDEDETVLLYTDGVTEAENEANEEFGVDGLKKILDRDKELRPEELIENVIREIKQFAGNQEQFDDITMVVLRSLPEGGKGSVPVSPVTDNLEKGVEEGYDYMETEEMEKDPQTAVEEVETNLEIDIENKGKELEIEMKTGKKLEIDLEEVEEKESSPEELFFERRFDTALSEISGLLEMVEEFLEKVGMGEESFEIQLAVEEWYVNIVKHAFGGEPGGEVHLKMRYSDGTLHIEMADAGPEFDPHSIQPPEKPDSVEEAKIGGLGIFFIRRLMDETEYRREGDRNIFIMRKTFDGSVEEDEE